MNRGQYVAAVVGALVFGFATTPAFAKQLNSQSAPATTKQSQKNCVAAPSQGAVPAALIARCGGTRPPSEFATKLLGPGARKRGVLVPTDLGWGWESLNLELVNFALDTPATLNHWGNYSGNFLGGLDFDASNTFTTLYAIENGSPALFSSFNTATGAQTPIGNAVGFGGETFTGLSADPDTGVMYAASCNIATSSLYTINIATGAATRIGAITNSPCTIGIAIQPGTGQMYGYDIVNDSLLSIDKATAAGTIIGPLGFDANFGQGLDFDDSDGTLYLFAFNLGNFAAELRTANLATGATTLVGTFPNPGTGEQVAGAGIAASSGPPPPQGEVNIGDATVTEGNSGTVDALFPVTLTPALADPVSVDFTTQDGTATTADNDYLPLTGTVVFAPGETLHMVTVSVIGDLTIEPDETFVVSLSNAVGTTIVDGVGLGTIINDDVPLGAPTRDELIHDSRETRDLDTISRFWRISQKAHSSYEVVTDAVTGDIGLAGPDLLRLDSDGTTILQSGVSATGGTSKTLRFGNNGASDNNGEFIQVRSAGCTSDCDSSDTVRIRAYDTTYRVSRFNNSVTQITVLVIANPTDKDATGTVWFYSTAGQLLTSQTLTIPAHATSVLNTAALGPLQGQSGSATFSNDAAFGALTGKAVAVEPATGFTFDTPLVARTATTKMVPRDN